MSDSTSGVICDVCGLYDARVFDPCGAKWCRVCDLLGLGELAVREQVEAVAEAMGKAFDEVVLFDPTDALGAKLNEALNEGLRESLAKPIDAAVLYGNVTEAGDPDTWGEPFGATVDYAAINERWRKQMGEAAAVPPAVEALDEINAGLKTVDDGVRPDFMGMLQQVLTDADVSVPGRLYTIPEPPVVVPVRADGGTCCGGGANPGGHEWNCRVYKAAAAIDGLIDETLLPVAEGDAVEHPSHYTSSKAACKGCGRPIECIDIVEHMGYSLGNVTKYVWRCDLKFDAIEDLRKARQYLDFEIAKREREAAAGA
ncbi:WhiB [Mycobacterium phage MacnCheese]|uniref:Uncharacterized protein n=1 Tax=Mycobacterium phage MacnCheese TaxID=2927982 RepID=I6X3C7_9CAUD|nr:WhiB [Mycobacterium phage MacnCheese]AFN37747.1 hypothetical protein MACNCHEESE_56 [Mycobacterium phage MacnCheese]